MAFDPFQTPSRPLTSRQRTEEEQAAPLSIPIVVPVTNAKTANVTLYTAPDTRFFHIERIAACNVGTGNATVDVHLVADGDSADDTNVVYDAYPINSAATDRLEALRGTLIEPGTAIVVVTSDATNGVNFWLWGVEIAGGSIAV